MPLDKEMETYRKELDGLLDKEGKFAVIQGEHVIDVLDTYEDALKRGYDQFGVKQDFMVKQILAVEQVLNFTRDITSPCPC